MNQYYVRFKSTEGNLFKFDPEISSLSKWCYMLLTVLIQFHHHLPVLNGNTNTTIKELQHLTGLLGQIHEVFLHAASLTSVFPWLELPTGLYIPSPLISVATKTLLISDCFKTLNIHALRYTKQHFSLFPSETPVKLDIASALSQCHRLSISGVFLGKQFCSLAIYSLKYGESNSNDSKDCLH